MPFEQEHVPDTVSYEKLLLAIAHFGHRRLASSDRKYTLDLANELLRLNKEVNKLARDNEKLAEPENQSDT